MYLSFKLAGAVWLTCPVFAADFGSRDQLFPGRFCCACLGRAVGPREQLRGGRDRAESGLRRWETGGGQRSARPGMYLGCALKINGSRCRSMCCFVLLLLEEEEALAGRKTRGV